MQVSRLLYSTWAVLGAWHLADWLLAIPPPPTFPTASTEALAAAVDTRKQTRGSLNAYKAAHLWLS